MEELNNVEITETNEVTTPAVEEPPKSFTQDDVNRIVQERLARERERLNSMINEDEGIKKELAASRMRLETTKALSNGGYPIDLADLADYSGEDACKESLVKLRKVYDLGYKKAVGDIYKANGREPGRGNSGNNSQISDKLRDAFRPKE